MYYVFKNEDEDKNISYGFIPEDKVAEESKEFAFKVLEELPEIDSSLDGTSYKLSYDEPADTFSWVVA